MKKTALICNYYILNYGSVLQSYALFRKLNQLGCEVTVIQYKDTASAMQRLHILLRLKLRKLLSLRSLSNYIVKRNAPEEYFRLIQERRDAFDEFVNKYFVFTRPYDSVDEIRGDCSKFDRLVLSSDQLWGMEDIIRDYHTLRWVPEDIYTIAYATSFGVSQLPRMFMKRTAGFIPRINCVSVREESGADIIKKTCGRDVPVVMDPTLLMSREEWGNVTEKISAKTEDIINGDYIFVYLLGIKRQNYDKVREFSIEVKLPIVSIKYAEQYQEESGMFADIYVNPNPGEFVRLIRDAKYVIGDSFHMCVFSIIFQKSFLVLDRYSSNNSNSRNTRIENLLKKLDLTGRHVDEMDYKVTAKMLENIDYSHVQELYQDWYEKSMNYLVSSLQSSFERRGMGDFSENNH